MFAKQHDESPAEGASETISDGVFYVF
jgi:hypothetical protein